MGFLTLPAGLTLWNIRRRGRRRLWRGWLRCGRSGHLFQCVAQDPFFIVCHPTCLQSYLFTDPLVKCLDFLGGFAVQCVFRGGQSYGQGVHVGRSLRDTAPATTGIPYSLTAADASSPSAPLGGMTCNRMQAGFPASLAKSTVA